MKKLSFLFIFVLITEFTFAQEKLAYIPITSSDPSESTEDLRELNNYFVGTKLVGLGESTHGTSEFTQMRHRIFKFLVEEHGFNTFFLEEDYASCLRVDAYIKGADDQLMAVVKSFNQWPWMTQEMATVIEWMRDYNGNHPDKQLSFIGVDMQYFTRTLNIIDSLLILNKPSIKDKLTAPEITDEEFMRMPDNSEIQKFEKILQERTATAESIELSLADKNTVNHLLRGLKFIIEEKNNLENGAYRDVKMAENIMAHFEASPDTKGIFWAANAHVLTRCSDKKKGNCRAGANLRNWMGEAYFSIAFLFDQGSFNAYYLTNADGDKNEVNNYTLGEVSVDPAVEGSIAARMRNTPDSILFIPKESFKNRKDEKLSGRHVGARFINYAKTGKQTRFEKWYIKNYDAVILMKQTSATHLLNN